MSKGGKQVAFKVPPSKLAPDADAWIANRASDPEAGSAAVSKPAAVALKEKMSRFTIDVPESLHRRVKMQCAARGQKMADMMRDLLEREFPTS
jgi:predicted DNA binding CopG/RHH family protein